MSLTAQSHGPLRLGIEWDGIDAYQFRVQNWENIESAQFTIRWDTAYTEYLSLGNVNLDDFDFLGFNDDNAADGLLLFVGTSLGSTKQDGEIIFSIRVETSDTLRGRPYYSNDPLMIEFSDDSGRIEDPKSMPGSYGAVRSLSLIEGSLALDQNSDCLLDTTDLLLSDRLISFASDTETFHTYTGQEGNYRIELPEGDYEISASIPDHLASSCLDMQILMIGEDAERDSLDILYQVIDACPELKLELTSEAALQCSEVNFLIQYQNQGTAIAPDAYIEIALLANYGMLGSDLSFTDLGNDVYRFDIGDLAPGATGEINFSAESNCAASLAENHSLVAEIFPNDDCLPQSPDWSGASLSLDVECRNDSVIFIVTNDGIADMTTALEGIILEDDLGGFIRDVDLGAGDRLELPFEGLGSTWRMKIPQVANHPGQSRPTIAVEGCGRNQSGDFSRTYIAQYSEDDVERYRDIDNQASVDQIEAFAKMSFPTGFGAEKYIQVQDRIEYQIRFENRTDSVLTHLVIRDSLSPFLDISSLRDIYSNHDVKIDLLSDHIIEFDFGVINLPPRDSMPDQSSVSIHYSIGIQEGTSPGSVIRNTGEVFVDYQDAVMSNEVFHTVIEDITDVITSTPATPAIEPLLTSPNPSGNEVIALGRNFENSFIEIQDILGITCYRSAINGNKLDLQHQHLTPGTYLITITDTAGIKYLTKHIIK